MVLLLELEYDRVARIGRNVGRFEKELVGSTYDDSVCCSGGPSGSRGSRRRVGRGGRRSSGGWSRGAASCSGLEGIELVAWVDSEDHSLLTVVALSAVGPDRVGVYDGKDNGGESLSNIVADGDTVCIGLLEQEQQQRRTNRTHNEESKPPAKGAHGSPSEDWVTV